MAAPFVIMVIRLHVMIMFFKCTDCQVLSTCLLPIYNQECDLNCTTADQSKPISFYKLPDAINPIAQCLGINCMVINASLTAMYSIQSTDSTTTTFRIKNLSWDEKGKWRCEYNSTQDTTDLGFAKFPDDIEYSGLSNNSDIESGTVMQITMKCLYTEIPTLVTLIYQSTGGTARSIPVTCTDTTSSCANNNFVSKLCMPIIQVGTGVVCDGNYSIEIATSVLGNEERKYSLLNGITIKCKSPDSPKSNLGPIIGATVATLLVIVLVVIIVYKKHYRKDHRSESLDGMKEVETATHSVLPVGTGNQFVEPSHKTPVGTGNQFVEPSHKTPVGTGTQLLQPVPKVLSQIDYHKGMPLEPEGPLKIKTRQGHVEFQWKPPKSDGGSEITEYIVEVNGIKFDTWETFATSSSMKLKVPMEKFKDGKVMSFRVRAGNENGLSEPLLAQKPFTLQNSHDLLANRPVVTNQGRGHEGFLPRNSVGTEHKESSLLEQVPIDRTLPKPV